MAKTVKNAVARQVELIIRRLHGREKQNLLDVVLIGQKHGETIHSQPKSSRGWQTVFQGRYKRIVHYHGFIVTGTSRLGLF